MYSSSTQTTEDGSDKIQVRPQRRDPGEYIDSLHHSFTYPTYETYVLSLT